MKDSGQHGKVLCGGTAPKERFIWQQNETDPYMGRRLLAVAKRIEVLSPT
jgi:hypothetical protein